MRADGSPGNRAELNIGDRIAAITVRLYESYKAGGHTALEAMKGVEPLFLRNELVKELKGILPQAEASDRVLQQKEKLVDEINDITDWINGKLRQQERDFKSNSFDLER